ncbi:MAG: alpha-L-fucosidase [Chitinophagia bacterium]|jgi:alpha-L-fucosidase
MKFYRFLLSLLVVTSLSAQPYLPNWESLDSRPVPSWFSDAKFGIFIHWGVYAVPAFTSKGGYAEWYQQGLEAGDSIKREYHRKKFGNLTYYQLADQFKAELYQPDEWAKLFEKSGAKYIVLTSKHHDGFALWPSNEASRTWGFGWNALVAGPRRDLLGDLFRAVRKTSVRAGMYYSLYEWFNPLWKSDRNKYVSEHMWPQMKELINNYQPDVFWTDGDWDANDETWKSKDFLTWLYNESPVKEKVVTYDRWGSGIRFKHGGVFTPEYQPELDFDQHPWEESRGMGYSYGYNREEDAWDYNSSQSLIYHLIDKVSRGGNFLLDIGPDEHGKIPPIMQERLLDIGKWLSVNGEAIYGTSRWKSTCQWGEGKRDYKAKKGEDIMLKLTVQPNTGYAVKEVFYTYRAGTNNLYAILPKYPANGQVVLKNLGNQVPLKNISLLATGAQLPATMQGNGNDVLVQLPPFDPEKFSTASAYVIKIAGFGAFQPKPAIQIDYQADLSGALVTLRAPQPGLSLSYILNNQPQPSVYDKPFSVKGDLVIKAFAAADVKLLPGDTAVATVSGLSLLKSVKAPANLQPGLQYQYVEADAMDMSVLTSVTPKQKGIVPVPNESVKMRKDKYGLIFDGYIQIEKTGGYQFFTKSDDGSILLIDDKEIVNNDGNHGSEEKSGRCILEKGYHRFRILYFDSGGGNDLSVSFQPFGLPKKPIDPALLFHSPNKP